MLLGLGQDEQTQLDHDIDTLLLAHPRPTQGDVEDFLKLFVPGEPRNIAARSLIDRGLPADVVAKALTFVNTTSTIFTKKNVIGALSIASAVVSGIHGYRRNQSIGWGLWWFIAGSIFPVVTPTIAIAQGFSKRKGA